MTQNAVTTCNQMKLIIRFVFFILFFSNAEPQVFGQGIWNTIPDFPGTARDDAFGFTANGNGYVGTGLDVTFGLKNDVWKYDPSTNSWSQAADFGGTPRQYTASFSIGLKGYVFGGIDLNGVYQNDLWIYDAGANSWAPGNPLPGSGRSGAMGFALNGAGYITTGRNGLTCFTDLWKYLPAFQFRTPFTQAQAVI